MLIWIFVSFRSWICNLWSHFISIEDKFSSFLLLLLLVQILNLVFINEAAQFVDIIIMWILHHYFMIGAQCNSGTKPTFWSCWYNVWAIWNPILEILPGYLDRKSIDKDSHSGKSLTLDHFELSSILWSVVALFI